MSCSFCQRSLGVVLPIRMTTIVMVALGTSWSAVADNPPETSAQTVIPGLVSSPTPLSGGRRWQMYTKLPGTSAENVAWSPDGRWLAIANGQIVRLMDYQNSSPELKLVLAGHNDNVKAVRFNTMGDRLATASADGTVRIWDADGREVFVYRDHEDAVHDVSWHPDGTRLASASLDGTVRIWSTNGKTIAVLRDHEAPVNAVAWNPNGKLLTSGCENKTIRYWSETGVPGPVVDAHIGPVKSMAWNADGSQLLSCDFGIEATNDGDEDRAHMKVWDALGKPVSSVLIDQPLSFVTWSPDGKRAAAGSWRSYKLWTVGERQVQAIRPIGLSGVVPVAWRPNTNSIAAGPFVSEAVVGQSPVAGLRNVSLNAIGLNPQGTILGIGRGYREFELFGNDGKQLFRSGVNNNVSTDFRTVQAIRWSPDGTTLIPGTRYDNMLQRYDIEGKPVEAATQLPGDTRSVTWSRDGKKVAAAGDLKNVSLLDLETSKATLIGKQKHGITQVRFTPDQTQICSAGYDSCIRFWSLDGKPLKVLETILAPIDGLAWSSDGQVMATGHQDGTVRFWSGSGEQLNVVGGHSGHVMTLEFNPAGTLLASGSRDNSIRIWKQDGTHVSTLRGHLGGVYGVDWTPDGSGLYSCSEDGSIRKWNVETGITEWQALIGEAGGYVTIDVNGRIKHGDEKILESDFAFFAEDNEHRLKRINWPELRSALQTVDSTRAN